MPSKKLNTVLFGAWNSYAVSMMSVLEDCRMWDKEFTFQKFLGVTGIAFQFCMDSRCSALPITDYDWIAQNRVFMERIGVATEVHFANTDDADFNLKQKGAIERIKQAIDDNKSVAAWGIDTGEFGIIYGYDDDDNVFFTKGIGSNSTCCSIPILYNNLGKTFEPAPVLYCEIPVSNTNVDWKQKYIESLRIYCDDMRRSYSHSERSYGLSAYDAIISSLKNDCCDSFGLRYCAGIYFERKEAMFMYVDEIKSLFKKELIEDVLEGLRKISDLWRELVFDILEQDMCGWNHLHKPISKDSYTDIISIVNEMKLKEINVLKAIDKLLE